jgi:hypothetical protein
VRGPAPLLHAAIHAATTALRAYSVVADDLELGERRTTSKTTPDTTPTPSESSDPDVLTEDERWLRCVSCGARVTRESARISVNGRHEHEFMNPSGIRYVVGCYSTAPGCTPEGERSRVWTWFPGHAWQIERCRRCMAHLGWSFHGVGSFFGLIRDRLL